MGCSTHLLLAIATPAAPSRILTTGMCSQSRWHRQGCPKGGLPRFRCTGRGELSDCLSPRAIQMWAFLSGCLCTPGLPSLLQVGQSSRATICHISTFTFPAGTSSNLSSLGKAALFSSVSPVSKGPFPSTPPEASKASLFGEEGRCSLVQ